MDIELAREKSQKIGISEVQIIREEYEMILLYAIFNSPMGTKLVFKGGTALRLAYGSPRFSEDLDFSQINTITTKEFTKWCGQTAKGNKCLELGELIKKRNTLFALYKIKDDALANTISIKMEISQRKEKMIKGSAYKLVKLRSEVTPITALAQVASLNKIRDEKLSIIPRRIRDVFDLWYIGQILKEDYEMDFGGFQPNEVKRELNKLLSKGSRRLIEPWLVKK